MDDEQYLRLRFSQLNAFDRNVTIMIDEIYLSKHIEASGGQLFGLPENLPNCHNSFMLRDKIIIQWISGHGWYCSSKNT